VNEPVQVLPGGSHSSPGSRTLLPQFAGIVVVVVTVTVVVVPGGVVVVVVGGGHAPPASHASQQLGSGLTQAVPFFVLHFSALRSIVHLVLPFLVRQQATAPSRPQVDRAAHSITSSLHSSRSRSSRWARFATRATHTT
jgi:hypothetical protein